MKAWLARAAANTAVRGSERRNRLARWSRWFPPAPVVDESCFQGPDDPYPRHWREVPRPWPPADQVDVRHLRDALGELPRPWRDVVSARDVEGRDPEQTGRDLGLSADQQRAMLNRARVLLRDRLARFRR